MPFGGETAESYYDEGLTASMKGDLGQAIAHFERAIQLDNSYAAAYHQLGKCYLRLGKAKKAAAFLEQVVSAKPDQIPPRVDLGYALLDLNRTQEARRIFIEVTAVKQDNGRAQLGLAYCAFHEGNWNEALTQAQEAVNVGGANFAALFLLGRAAQLAGFPEVSVEHLNRADALLEKSVETSPEQPEGYYLRGELHFVQGEFGKALDNYRAAEDRAQAGQHYAAYGEHFDRLDIVAKRGLCLQRMGQLDGAREAGEQILKVNPEHKIGQALKEG